MVKATMRILLMVGLLCAVTATNAATAVSSASRSAAIKQFLAHSVVEYGSASDAKSVEGRLYAWAKAGVSYDGLVARTEEEFKLTPDVAARLVPLVLQRGSAKGISVDSELVAQFIALSRAHPENQLLLIEAGRTIDGHEGCETAPYARLLAGRGDADADRVILYDHFFCLPLLTERTTLNPGSFATYLTLAQQAGNVDNALLRLTFLRLADKNAESDRRVPQVARQKLRMRRLTVELQQGRIQQAIALLPARDGEQTIPLLPWLDADTRRALAAAFLLVSQPDRSAWWRRSAVSKESGVMPWADTVNVLPPEPTVVNYELQLLGHWTNPPGKDSFDFLVERYRVSEIATKESYWDGIWARLYNRLAARDGYPGLTETTELSELESDQIQTTRNEARKDCYRCAADLLAMIDHIADEPIKSETRQRRNASTLPPTILKQMDAEIAAPLPYWTEHKLPVKFQQPASVLRAKPSPESGLLLATPTHRTDTPQWVSRLPSGKLIRYQQDGKRIVAITVSQSLDPTGEVSAGGYWVSISEDGGRHFARPLYTGLRMFEPYVVVPDSRLPMIIDNRLQLEVQVRKLDDANVFLPPVALLLKAHRNDLFLDISLADLSRDSDGDGLTDIEEWAMLLNPQNADTDDDGISDGRDLLPQVSASRTTDRHAAPLAAMLQKLFGKSLGAIVTTSATAKERAKSTALGGGDTDRYNHAGAMFVEAPAAYFAGITLRKRVIVLNEAQVKALKRARGLFFCMSIPVFEVSRDGQEALVVWSNGWTGGTFLLKKRAGKWEAESLSQWLT